MPNTPLSFDECLKKALAPHGVPWRAPEITRFLVRKAKELGLKNPCEGRQTVYNWMDGKKPKAETYAILSRILGVNTRWLIEGTGDIRRGAKLTPEEEEILIIYRELSEASCQARDNWVSQGRTMLSLITPKSKVNPFGRTS